MVRLYSRRDSRPFSVRHYLVRGRPPTSSSSTAPPCRGATVTSELGPIEVSFKDKERVNVPAWAGVGAIVVGAVLLASRGKR